MTNGLLVIDKPAGITSHDVVARCRRILGTKKIGHTGTLDPFATGVVVVLVGKATRLAQFLDKDEKEYDAVVRFGFATDSGDLTGARLDADDAPVPSASSLAEAIGRFTGEILQTPPMYSAKKVDGKKLYELARKGIEIEREPVRVTVFGLEAVADAALPETDVHLRVTCSAGTYVRTLAEDIARSAGSAAHLAALRRTRAGRFTVAEALTLEGLEKAVADGRLADHLVPMDAAVVHLPAVALDAERIARTRDGLGTLIGPQGFDDGGFVRIKGPDDDLIAIGTFDAADGTVRPRLVLV
jgi:tRNA pseudouridine55 synthase